MTYLKEMWYRIKMRLEFGRARLELLDADAISLLAAKTPEEVADVNAKIDFHNSLDTPRAFKLCMPWTYYGWFL